MSVSLDVEAVRAEIKEGPYSERVKEVVLAATETEVSSAIDAALDDAWWEAYDRTRSAAIDRIVTAAGLTFEEIETEGSR